MKLSASKELTVQVGSEVQIPITLLRATEFSEPAKVELVTPELPQGLASAEPLVIGPQASGGTILVRLASDPALLGEHSITLRATSLKDGKWPVVSEATVMLIVK